MSKTAQISIPHILILNPKVDVDKLYRIVMTFVLSI